MSTIVIRPECGTEAARQKMAAAWRRVCEFLEICKPAKVTVEEFKDTRTLQQNAKMWAMLTDISKQVEWLVDGKFQKLSPEDWKDILSAGLKKHQRVAQGIFGGFVMLGERTSKMSIAEMSDVIELCYMFGAEREPPVIWGKHDLEKAA